MDSLTQAVMMWQIEGAVAIAALLGVYLYQRGAKIWSSPDGVSLIFILGCGLGIVTFVFIMLRDRIHWFGNRYGLYFFLLYLWCAFGTLFISYRQIGTGKLIIGLMAQAGIVYSLYKWM